VTSLTDIENTDSSGATTIKVDGVYPGTDAWISGTKSGYYPDKQAVSLAETISGASASLELENIGVLNIKVMNAEPADNITLSGSTVQLDQGAGPFSFDLVLETSEYESVLRDLQVDQEQGAAWSSISADITAEVTMAEGVDTSLVSGDPNLIDSDEAVWNFAGDLEHLKDIRIHYEVTNVSATGELVSMSINDLLDGEAIHGVTGISENTPTIDVV